MNRMTEKGKKQLEALVAQVMEDCSARGVAVGIVNAKGEIQYEQYFGYRDEENKLPINRDTIFGMASVTKSFTALSIRWMEFSLWMIRCPSTFRSSQTRIRISR